ncbi:hypothetical protein HDG40_004338 [Paraburkholderia sp. JPY158]|uniref:Uncharacterized protein n=1 Tax=Paraburkholderia atlantica TaxID=2654982 RepID=A0A7W8QA60_PARAM|nr:hypothetical protein [Paraburkholderia atlantica]
MLDTDYARWTSGVAAIRRNDAPATKLTKR